MGDSQAYVQSIRQALTKALCIINFPSPSVERCNRPEIEYQDNEELILEPILLTKGTSQRCYIEPSINSCRVSFRIKHADSLEGLLTKTYLRYLMQRAESFPIVRRVPLPGYNISFLITARHCEQYDWRKLIDILCNVALDAHAEFATLKLLLNTRNRTVVSDYKRALVLPQLVQQYYAVGKAPHSGAPR